MNEDNTRYAIVDTENGDVIVAENFDESRDAERYITEELIRYQEDSDRYEAMTRNEAQLKADEDPTWIQEFRDELESRGFTPGSSQFQEQMTKVEGMQKQIEQMSECDHEEITATTRLKDFKSFFYDEIGGLDENPNLREANGIALRASCTECGKSMPVSLNVNVGVDE